MKENQRQEEKNFRQKLDFLPKTFLFFAFFLIFSMFIGLLFIVYWVGMGRAGQAFLLGVVAPFMCSIPASVLLLLLYHLNNLG